ncbi:hypothetical protein PHSC3_001635 [Chlamydiales bacterium STE3]|nr:hypothetical protein PHSC3_001635 [Chlamydiales bacterium STE3]
MRIDSLLNTFLYTVGWTAALLLAAAQMPLLAILGVLASLLFQLVFSYFKNSLFWVELFLAIYALAIGVLLETIFLQAGIIEYSFRDSHFPPLWLVLIYSLFSTTFNRSFSLINRHWMIPIGVGMLAPLSYLAGQRLGLCVFPYGKVIGLSGIALGWMAALSLLAFLNRRLLEINSAIDREFQSSMGQKMLFDGDCPLCSKEVDMLKTSRGNNHIDFIDIAGADYRPEEHQGISYETAMKEILSISQEGHIAQGTEAFYLIYAKAGWKGLAMFLKAPFFAPLSTSFYKVFAKNRLLITGRSKKEKF